MFAASVVAHILTTPHVRVCISRGTGEDSGRSREVEYGGDPLGGGPTHHPCCSARFTMGPTLILGGIRIVFLFVLVYLIFF